MKTPLNVYITSEIGVAGVAKMLPTLVDAGFYFTVGDTEKVMFDFENWIGPFETSEIAASEALEFVTDTIINGTFTFTANPSEQKDPTNDA